MNSHYFASIGQRRREVFRIWSGIFLKWALALLAVVLAVAVSTRLYFEVTESPAQPVCKANPMEET